MVFEITSLILVTLFLIVTFPLYPIFTYSYIGNQSPPLFVILTLLGLLIGYYYYKKTRKPEENKARELNIISKRRRYIIYFELIVLSSFICYNIIRNPTTQSQFSNITSSSNLRDFVILSNNGISIFIGVISMIIVYLYFFTNLNKAKYFSESSELQEKYADVFWSLFIIFMLGGFFILILMMPINQSTNSIVLNCLLFGTGFINLIFLVEIPRNLKKYFYNLNISEPDSLMKRTYNYKFLEDFQKEDIDYTRYISESILIMTFLWAIIALFVDCNIFLLLMTEYSLLVSHFWWGQLQLLPQKKTTIELTDADGFGNYLKITDVFVLSESPKDYIVILDKNNQISRIMKNSIYKLTNQTD
jgi:hypothetical protein